jgi:hypothetical protein
VVASFLEASENLEILAISSNNENQEAAAANGFVEQPCDHSEPLTLHPDNQSPADVDDASVVCEASVVGEVEGTRAGPSKHGDSVRCTDDMEPPATEPLDQTDSPVS